jgi:hypothetical protein
VFEPIQPFVVACPDFPYTYLTQISHYILQVNTINSSVHYLCVPGLRSVVISYRINCVHTVQSNSSLINLHRIVHNLILDTYKKQITKSFLAHPLAAEFQACDSPTQSTFFFDAIDEHSDTSGIQSNHEHVLQLVKELIHLDSPNLCICITSRPEVDI